MTVSGDVMVQMVRFNYLGSIRRKGWGLCGGCKI